MCVRSPVVKSLNVPKVAEKYPFVFNMHSSLAMSVVIDMVIRTCMYLHHFIVVMNGLKFLNYI